MSAGHEELLATCYHEAGHAVVAHHLGCIVKCVEVDGVCSGLYRYHYRKSTDLDQLCRSLAGNLAEREFNRSTPFLHGGGQIGNPESDRHNFITALENLGPPETFHNNFRTAKAITLDILLRHWETVERIARELEMTRFIDEKRLQKLLAPRSSPTSAARGATTHTPKEQRCLQPA
jgi:hypothetical protein